MKVRPLVCLIPLLAVLAGCEPSDSDLQNALQQSLHDTNSLTTGLFGDSGKIDILAVHKQKCDKQGELWRCDVSIETQLPIIGRKTMSQTLKFAKDQDRWTLVN